MKLLRCFPLAITLALALPGCAAPTFTDEERIAVQAYWQAPGRLAVTSPPDTATSGPFVVRLTPDGSAWFLTYTRALSDAGKTPPNREPEPVRPDWQKWVDSRYAADRRQAQEAADRANAVLGFPAPARDSLTAPAPGPMPLDLLSVCGNPPRFAATVAPLQATVTFDDGEAYTFRSHVNVRPRFGYYRFPHGTVAYGPAIRDLPEAERDAVFTSASLSPTEQRVLRAVSKLEGGFESVNTYDTGYVSVGFIQFTTGPEGRGSLASVLAREKADRPEDFQRDFRRFGIDVDEAGVLAVVDPETGAELHGAEAVSRVVEDRRLTAVFQRAGRHSAAFRLAQVLIAKAEYWPADIDATLTVDGSTLTAKVADIIKSEAGLATLFDRKVNRGNIRPFDDVVSRVLAERGLTEVAQLAAYEKEIVAAMKYRVDFLADASLGQPAEPPAGVAEKAPAE